LTASQGLQEILEQVEAEIRHMREIGETGEVIIYVGGNQCQAESRAKRKREPVRWEWGRPALVKRVRP
jgi:hypothetical protein